MLLIQEIFNSQSKVSQISVCHLNRGPWETTTSVSINEDVTKTIEI